MRKEYKVFSLMVVVVFFLSLAYNVNKLYSYAFFPQWLNEKFFGLSYTIALSVCAYMICKNARKGLEKAICKVFLWIAFSALADELLFNPFKAQIYEHITGAIITIIIIINARRKENCR
jgi:hypothetical protein